MELAKEFTWAKTNVYNTILFCGRASFCRLKCQGTARMKSKSWVTTKMIQLRRLATTVYNCYHVFHTQALLWERPTWKTDERGLPPGRFAFLSSSWHLGYLGALQESFAHKKVTRSLSRILTSSFTQTISNQTSPLYLQPTIRSQPSNSAGSQKTFLAALEFFEVLRTHGGVSQLQLLHS